MMPLGAGRVAILLALVIFVCTAVHASAQLYEWTDEQGRKNFTDDPNRIPEKYRSKASQSPGLQATPDTIRRDAERRRRDDAAFERARETREAEARQRFIDVARRCRWENPPVRIRDYDDRAVFANELARFPIEKW